MKKMHKYRILLLAMFFLCFDCIEEIELKTQDFESVLVVEATITNEFKFQEIKISRTHLLEANEQIPENNANVTVIDNQGNTYNFTQNTEGTYISDIEFEASPNAIYTLLITTNDGMQYSSSETNLTPNAEISNLYAELTNDTNGQKVTVFIDSNGIINDAKYFRYEYEETYKVKAPLHTNEDLIIYNLGFEENGGISYEINIVPREQEERICFSTHKSLEIIQSETSELEENIVSRLPIRRIDIDDSILMNRYSILVKQYTQSLESYTFYKIISQLGDLESTLSENQPGFVSGNILGTNNDKKVIGYFDVASFASSRIYFNFSDFNLLPPDYFVECNIISLDYSDNLGTAQDGDSNERVLLYGLITDNDFKFVGVGTSETVYLIVKPECGDCTSFSSNIQPDFWED